jgi:hypothetical protein
MNIVAIVNIVFLDLIVLHSISASRSFKEKLPIVPPCAVPILFR